jgi:hypothetical protein
MFKEYVVESADVEQAWAQFVAGKRGLPDRDAILRSEAYADLRDFLVAKLNLATSHRWYAMPHAELVDKYFVSDRPSSSYDIQEWLDSNPAAPVLK